MLSCILDNELESVSVSVSPLSHSCHRPIHLWVLTLSSLFSKNSLWVRGKSGVEGVEANVTSLKVLGKHCYEGNEYWISQVMGQSKRYMLASAVLWTTSTPVPRGWKTRTDILFHYWYAPDLLLVGKMEIYYIVWEPGKQRFQKDLLGSVGIPAPCGGRCCLFPCSNPSDLWSVPKFGKDNRFSCSPLSMLAKIVQFLWKELVSVLQGPLGLGQ